MRKGFCILLTALALSSAGLAQSLKSEQSSYQSAIGVRLGTGYYDFISASFKTFIAESPGAIELNLGFEPSLSGHDWTNLSFAASYQYHFDIPAVQGLKWFIGGGISMYNTFSNDQYYNGGFGLGLFPMGGVDYKFANIPLNVSADIRPTIGLVHPNDYYNNFYPNFGVSARYTFR